MKAKNSRDWPQHITFAQPMVEHSIPLPDNCELCPHRCGADRAAGMRGLCGCSTSIPVAGIHLHHGEEPVISGTRGICNVFFGHCNLACIYCQNHQISSKAAEIESQSVQMIARRIAEVLQSSGSRHLGFVSPSHVAWAIPDIVHELKMLDFNPTVVYNSNGYDAVETLRKLEPWVDVFLPDFKYADNELALKLSGNRHYKDTVILAVKEMYRQKGSTLLYDEDGLISSGLIIRHLVLPGFIQNSKWVLEAIADISTSLAISLMSQYHPVKHFAECATLNRSLLNTEYNEIVDWMESLGFYKGWTQQMDSHGNYLPDFDKEKPFG